MHPLPRSLVPLTGESLPGFILRLSHRLNVPPLHIARMAEGRSEPTSSHIRHRLLLELDPSDAVAFAHATRLSLAEVMELTLAGWKERYPPIGASSETTSRAGRDPWLFISPRHCPNCLAGDASPLQKQLGGAWQKAWHLPVVFACLEHKRYLEHHCRRCGAAESGTDALIHRANDPSLHPAQCRRQAAQPSLAKRRTSACGTRLERTRPRKEALQPTERILRLQGHILDLLAPGHPPEEASQYFTDLRLVAALVTSSWPQTRSLVDGEVVALMDTYVHNVQAAGNTAGERNRVLHTPPRDAALCAALLSASHTLLQARDLRNTLAELLESSRKNGTLRDTWSRLFNRLESSCSARVRHAAEPLTRTFRRASGPHGSTGMFRSDYRPEHVPAFLDPRWFEEHFSDLEGITPKILRRTASVRLVHWVSGGSMNEAAEFLGISPGRMQFTLANDAHRWSRALHGPAVFEKALHDLADQLAAETDPIDYHYRRSVLEDWNLSRGEWQALVNRLSPTSGAPQPVLDDRKRQDASIFIWSHVTRGEHLFAPRPIEAGKTEHVQRAWANRRHTTWFQLTRPDALPHYAELRELLVEHADSLARQIDAGAAPPRARERLWLPSQPSPSPPPRQTRTPEISGTRWIRSYYDDLDTWSYFELDSEGWALRHVDLQGPTLKPVTAAALSEVLGIRDSGDRTAMAVYQHTYGILAEGSLDGWEETDCAAEITSTEFERVWGPAREAITSTRDH
ncbi:TniQ family protein [Streptomyces sp. G7(2002)]|uniref:TniQ family protein n=1 Tax=Streptomyces sp. G7(2002) TaxID=2971798 RepID=UPI00237E1E46|nr:TniQ family protein [Streptomyces sp. G7(2002)]WDT54088.1 TniQ family protein [Streptomyces sp. G7(2002)]